MKNKKRNYQKVRNVVAQIVDKENKTPKANILKDIQEVSSEVVRASLRDWQNAYEIAKDVEWDDRRELLEIYETIELDTHISAVTETIYHGVCSMDFEVQDENGEVVEDIKHYFSSKWFKDWVSIVIESIFWGFSGIQYGGVENERFTSIDSIPRYNIRPKQRGVAKNQYRDKADILFDKEPYKSWTTFVYPRQFGDSYKLGKYNKVAKWFILKREVTQFWAIFNELFGHPFRVTKTAIRDNVRRKNAIEAMEAMVTASYAVIDSDDEIEFVAPATGSGYSTFKDFLEVADKQISKALVGSTMVIDEGSSRSQSETHENNTNSFIWNYAGVVESTINDELIPKMAKFGFKVKEGYKFKYVNIDKLTKSQWADIIDKLGNKYDIDTEFIQEVTGIPVEEKAEPIPTFTNEDELQNKGFFKNNRLINFYKKVFK